MWKKMLVTMIALVTLADTLCVGDLFLNTRINAATNLKAISNAEQIIVGTDSNGDETI